MNREAPRRALRAVGIVLPVHDEEELLPAALHGLEVAVETLSPSVVCRVAIVLDSCRDASSVIAGRWAARRGALVIHRDDRSVGRARRSGCQALLARWSDLDREQIWLATTDADSRVPRDWLTVQMEAHSAGVDLWAGRVRVSEKSATVRRWTERYAAERDPIHGASLGFTAAMYAELGGFRSLSSGEDRDLHHRAVTAGFRIRHDAKAVVTTSSRRHGRAPLGFADVLHITEQQERAGTAAFEEYAGSAQAG
jgi:hypothetical protein